MDIFRFVGWVERRETQHLPWEIRFLKLPIILSIMDIFRRFRFLGWVERRETQHLPFAWNTLEVAHEKSRVNASKLI